MDTESNKKGEIQKNKRNPKKTKFGQYCMNCGSRLHNARGCLEAVTSYGIILMSSTFDKVSDTLVLNKCQPPNLVSPDTNDTIHIDQHTSHVPMTNSKELALFCGFKNDLKFLMIRRKHTLGFLEFIRGRYYIDNVDGIIFLFKQMTPEEIKKISSYTFDALWFEVWGNRNKNSHSSEYAMSKEKFSQLSDENNGYLPLRFYVDNVTPLWDQPEWGFPKGRRNVRESDLSCAVREFKEETGLNDQDFVVLTKINPIEETFTGTNGVRYKHIYYLAISTSKKKPFVDKNNRVQSYEIGDIGYFSCEESTGLIRPYHIERLRIVVAVFVYILNYLVQFF